MQAHRLHNFLHTPNYQAELQENIWQIFQIDCRFFVVYWKQQSRH